MSQPTKLRLKDILALTRPDWDNEQTRPAVREAFHKVLDCGTAALGAEVFASANEKRVVYHTCKSRACPSCGYRAATLWQRAHEEALHFQMLCNRLVELEHIYGDLPAHDGLWQRQLRRLTMRSTGWPSSRCFGGKRDRHHTDSCRPAQQCG